MAGRRFILILAAGLFVGYVTMLFIISAVLTPSWFITTSINSNGSLEYTVDNALFGTNSAISQICQAMMCLGFIVNLIACITGIASSCSLTRPSMATMAVRRLRLKPYQLRYFPKCSGLLFIISGILVMIASAVASAQATTGYGVILAWLAFVLSIISGVILLFVNPPNEAQLCGEESMGGFEMKERRNKFVEVEKQGTPETLPRYIADAATLTYSERQPMSANRNPQMEESGNNQTLEEEQLTSN